MASTRVSSLVRRWSDLTMDARLYSYVGEPSYADIIEPESQSWQLNSTGITVNGQSTPALNQSRLFIFDSGTSNIVLPTVDAEVRLMFIQ